MAKWIEISVFNGVNKFVNTDLVRYVMPYGERTRLYFTDTQYITCVDDYEELQKRIEKEGR